MALLIGFQIACCRPGTLLGRFFWLDEYLTHLVASDADIVHSVRAIAGGVDTNPPTYHLLLRAFASIFPASAEVTYRVFALLNVWVALVAAYVLLRRCFGVGPSVVAVLSLWSHRLVIEQAFEARFYAPMLASTALLCLLLSYNGKGFWFRLSLVAVAALTASLHYFGVIAVAAAAVGDWIAHRQERKSAVVRSLLLAAGALVVLTFIPLLRAQSSGMRVSTWAPPVTGPAVRHFLDGMFAIGAVAVVSGVWWLSQCVQGASAHSAPHAPRQRVRSLGALVPMSALVLVPVAILAFSVAVQPALAPRYLIASTLSILPPLALLAPYLGRRSRFVVVAALILISTYQLRKFSGEKLAWQRDQEAKLGAARSAAHAGLRVLAVERRDAYLLHYQVPELAARTYLVDMSRTSDGASEKGLVFETDLAVKVRRFYDMPPLIAPSGLAELGPTHVVPSQRYGHLMGPAVGVDRTVRARLPDPHGLDIVQ